MGLPMSRLDVQRRMRPSISNLIRQVSLTEVCRRNNHICRRRTLYPSLEDHDIVRNYPRVRGLAYDMFFLDHRHTEEGGGEESVSKTNSFEVRTCHRRLSLPSNC
jgi:hypothetical protein